MGRSVTWMAFGPWNPAFLAGAMNESNRLFNSTQICSLLGPMVWYKTIKELDAAYLMGGEL